MKNKITKILMAFCFVFSCMSSITNDSNIISTMAKTGDNTKYFGGQESMFINDVADAKNVSLLEKGSFYEGKQLNKDYIMSYSLERLLVNFKKTSGIPSDYSDYGGWAKYGVGQGNGEIELLSAYSFLYAEEKDPAVLEKINQFVDILYECQEAYALKDPANAGYLAAFEITEVDSIEKTAYAFWPIFYTFGKNLEGYFDAYYYAGNQKAYEIWYKLGKYLAVRASKYDDATHQRILVKEYGDIAICFFQMYLLTGEEVFKTAAFKFIDEDTFDKLYNHVDPFSYIHCNRSIPVVRSAIFAYLATNEEKYLTIAKNGFDIMTTHRCFANGNTSETEDLHPEYETDTKGFASAETCCAYNYMKVCDLLYRITNDVYYMDYYENLLYNQILASIDWDTGMKTYYISMDSGFYKVYHDVENSFWCCTCTGWENFAKFNQNIYYNNANSLIVNLFINSQIEDPNTGLRRDGIGGAVKGYDMEIMQEYYQNGTRPMTGEYFIAYLKSKEASDGVRGYHIEDAIEEALQLHPNYMMLPWDSVAFYNQRFDLVEYGLKKMGFRLLPEVIEVDKINKNSYIAIKQRWINNACGKLCGKSTLVIKLEDENGNCIIEEDNTFEAIKILQNRAYNHISTISTKNLEGEVYIYMGIKDYRNEFINLPLDDKEDNLYRVGKLFIK